MDSWETKDNCLFVVKEELPFKKREGINQASQAMFRYVYCYQHESILGYEFIFMVLWIFMIWKE